MSFTEKAKIVNSGSLRSGRESTCSKLEYDPYLISVACSYTWLSIWGNLGDQAKGRSPKKLKSLIEVPYVAHLQLQVLSFNMNLIFSL